MSSVKNEIGVSFALNTASGVPFYRQIIQQIELAVMSGRLTPGSRLPTIRSLAIKLKINPNTIAKAYNELEIRGLLVTQVGSGTFVSDKKPEEDTQRKEAVKNIIRHFINELEALGVSIDEIPELLQEIQEESK